MTVGSGFRFVVCVPKKNDSALLVERAVVFLFLEINALCCLQMFRCIPTDKMVYWLQSRGAWFSLG